MERTMNQMINEGEDFVEECEGKKILIVSDSDTEGCTATALTRIGLSTLFHIEVRAETLIHDIKSLSHNKVPQVIDKEDPDVIMILDNSPEDMNYVLKLAEKREIFIADHHQADVDLSTLNKNIVHINPYFVKGLKNYFNYPTTWILYKIFESLTGIDERELLLTLIGIVSDYSGKQHEKLFDKFYKRHSTLKTEDIYGINSVFGKISEVLNSDHQFGGSGKLAIEVAESLEPAESVQDIFPKTKETKELYKRHRFVKREIEKFTAPGWKENAEIFNNLIIYPLDTNAHVNSPIANRLSFENKNSVYAIYRNKGRTLYGSLRRQDGKDNCHELVKYCVSGLDGICGGGGFTPAAGFYLEKRNWPRFRERLISKCSM